MWSISISSPGLGIINWGIWVTLIGCNSSANFPLRRLLRLYCEPAVHVTLALEDISEELVAEVLPSLDLVCVVDLDRPAPSIEKFVAARELSGCPVTVFYTEAEFNKRRESYVSK
ncbi:hypothetical protein EDB86DRAFT_2837555 [Lactarius hatsudake]|nr:hypothetical protein EDB86DRAFT_2837555 [Lactarius hatsudake]